jgi:Histidine kinase
LRAEPVDTAELPGSCLVPEVSAARRRREVDRWLDRRRLERQLHDGASLRLSALSLRLGLLDPATMRDESRWRARVDELQHELHLVLQELRDVARKIYPPLLDQAGLGAALGELAERHPGALVLEVSETDRDGEASGDGETSGDGGRRFGPAAEGAAYFVVAECLAVPPPARSSVLRVSVGADPRGLVLTAAGVDEECPDRVLDRVQPLGGTVEVAGTRTIVLRIPAV